MSFLTDFRAWLLAESLSPDPGQRIHHNAAPEKYSGPYVWFARRGRDNEDSIDQAKGALPFRIYVDVEAIAQTPDDAAALGESIESLHLHRGAFGDGTVQGVFVRDSHDNYTPRGMMGPQLLEWVAFDVEIVGYTPA